MILPSKQGLELAPPNDILQALQFYPIYLFVDVRLAISQLPGNMRITSWYRTVAHNAAVGGVADSQHLIGTGMDIAPRAVSKAMLLAQLHYDETVIDEGDHLHIQIWPAGVATNLVRLLRR